MISPTLLRADTNWVNCAPLYEQDLADRTIVYVFWSLGCDASIHRLTQIERVRHEFPGDTLTIAVHTPRYGYERNPRSLTSAVALNKIAFPVINDVDADTWTDLDAKGWPCTVIIDIDGNEIGRQNGAGDINVIREVVTKREKFGKQAHFDIIANVISTSDVTYPTHIAASDSTPNPTLAISSPANDEVMLVALDSPGRTAKLIDTIDKVRGPSATCFQDPDTILIAGGQDSALYRYSLSTRQISLITTECARISSIERDFDGTFVISDPVRNQLFRLDLASDIPKLGVIAGSGFTGCADGIGSSAELAQPTGLTLGSNGILFCDSASSKIRHLDSVGQVSTISGRSDFAWGYNDGESHKALFQRPSAIALCKEGNVLILDTGNNKLRRLKGRRYTSLGITGLSKPESMCGLPTGQVAIADTQNERIVMVSRSLSDAWELEIKGR